MAFLKRSISLTVPNPAATITGKVGLGAKYARFYGFSILLTGTDTAVRLKLTDSNSRVFYLDAADKDYKTAQVNTPVVFDDTTTGLSFIPRDATGAAAAAGEGGASPIVASPVTVEISNGGTAGDVIAVDLFVEV